MGQPLERFELLSSVDEREKQAARESEFAREVEAGLEGRPKSLPCRFFYDAEGSSLFEEICAQPEYDLTRAEREILARHAGEIAARLSRPLELVELGSGSAEKTELLLRALSGRGSDLRYVPVDICRDVLVESAGRLLARFGELSILAIEAEYRPGLRLLADRARGRKLVLWLGSNVGNLHRADACDFLADLRREMAPGDRLLLGVDLRKDRAILEAAYDDALGVTARFNVNLLARINRELGGTFDLASFRHRARYDMEIGRVDIHLESLRSQSVRIGALGRSFTFARGELVHTECSYKYSLDEIDALARCAGYAVLGRWLDSDSRFSLNLLAAQE